MSDHDHIHETKVMTTRELLKTWLQKKVGVTTKQPVAHEHAGPPPTPVNKEINTIAVVLDGEVQEVIRAENRLTALFLSEPEFILVTDLENRPTLGWKYVDGVFKNPNEENQIPNG